MLLDIKPPLLVLRYLHLKFDVVHIRSGLVYTNIFVSQSTSHVSVMIRVPALEAGGPGFDPGPRYTKDIKSGTSGYLAWCSAF